MNRRLIPFTLTLVLCFVPATLLAHSAFVTISPLVGEVLSQVPEEISISFKSEISAEQSYIEVFGPDGNRISKGTTYNDDKTEMKTELQKGNIPGVYIIKYRYTNNDGHIQKGSSYFEIK